MKKLNTKGFGSTEVFVIVLVVVIIGAIGWFIYNKQSENKQSNSSDQQVSQPSASKESKSPSLAKYMDVNEWGIRLEFEGADKVTYKMQTDDGGGQQVDLYLKESVTDVEACRSLGVGFSRSMQAIEGDNNTKVGDYYYQLSGGPGACSDDPAGPDSPTNQLRSGIITALGSGQFTLVAIPAQ